MSKADFKEYRKCAGLTQAEIAEKLGFSTTGVIRKFEDNGENIPDLVWANTLALCRNNAMKTLAKIERDIEEMKKKLFPD